ncbi:MAG: FecR domain-containing protein [Ferruginibacter sp.]
MLLTKERILYLLNAWSGNRATIAEEQELFSWVSENGHHELLHRHIQQLIEKGNTQKQLPAVDWKHLYDRILDKSAISEQDLPEIRVPWYRWSAAAAIIILLASGIYFYINNPSPKKVISSSALQNPAVNDVPAPAKNKAVLTLSDGSKIDLDSTGNGTLAQQGNVAVTKQPDGVIIYTGSNGEMLYNMLNVPRGSKVVSIKLSDGTQVWLNSESSLRYPASFTGLERKVEITGEAYFEVAHNQAMPFIVAKDGMEIKVLGTHFNINTYQDDRVNKVTLLEGSVKVSLNGHENFLKPGQQAQIRDDIKLINGVNIDEVMAWKNGMFQFGEKTDLQTIMKKIERWYDVDVNYEGGIVSQRFGGEIPMNSNLSQVLEILRTSGVKFTIDGKKVIVKP